MVVFERGGSTEDEMGTDDVGVVCRAGRRGAAAHCLHKLTEFDKERSNFVCVQKGTVVAEAVTRADIDKFLSSSRKMNK